MGEVSVRPAVVADYPVIAELTVAAYEADGQIEPGHPYGRELADVAAHAAAGEVLVATIDGAVVGSVLFVLSGAAYAELAQPGEAEFRMLAVAPSAQRRGAGEALVQACLERARAAGATSVVISARDFVESAQRLYRRLGFVRVPELDATPVPGVTLLALRRELEPAR